VSGASGNGAPSFGESYTDGSDSRPELIMRRANSALGASARADGSATHFVENLRGEFELIHVKNGDGADGGALRAPDGIALTVIGEDFFDEAGLFAQRFDAMPGATYLVRPDQHLCARWRSFDAAAVARAHQRAPAPRRAAAARRSNAAT
jgi:hypothetical protein